MRGPGLPTLKPTFVDVAPFQAQYFTEVSRAIPRPPTPRPTSAFGSPGPSSPVSQAH